MKTTNKKEWPVAIKSIVLAMAGAGLVSLPYMAYANPTGGQVVAGNVTIRQESATKIGITQTTAKGIIDWQKYSIGANEQVQYYQPTASSVTLNRVVGQDPSQILGRLTANGQIFLVNPNGIYFGKNAQVDVAGLVASTHNIRNEDFLAGKYNFNIPGNPGASVINEGTIRIADTGIAAFVAPSVANRGVIVARLGKVAMAAANGFTLDFHGDQLLSFLVTDEVAKTAFDINGKQLTSFVENSGRIEAQGGYVLLTAKAAESAIHGVINQSGVIEATTVGMKNGVIILNAGKGSLEVSGTLDTSAPNGGDGGFIETSGAQVSIAANTQVNTAAALGKNGLWFIDPLDITINGSIASAIFSALQHGDVTISTSGSNTPSTASGEVSPGNGDIFVNSEITWTANKFTLFAHRNININNSLSGSGTAKLALQYGQATSSGSGGDYILHNGAQINLPAGDNFSTKQGSSGAVKNFTVITSLGNVGSTTATDLQGMSGNLSKNYVLGDDIDATATRGWNSGAGFLPVGSKGANFTGSFAGLGHHISNLYINRPTAAAVGLFGDLSYGSVRDVGLNSVDIFGGNLVGGLIGRLWGSGASVKNTYTTGTVTGSPTLTIITGFGNGYVGGLIGWMTPYNDSGALLGGTMTLTTSYSHANVTGLAPGGLVGSLDLSTVSNSYAQGNVVSYTNHASIGGLVGGMIHSSISNSYSTGAVSFVNGGSGLASGFVGLSNGSPSSMSYWDTQTSGKSTSVGGTGKTTAQMQQQATYVGWDFVNTWVMSPGGYPVLRNSPAIASVALPPSNNPIISRSFMPMPKEEVFIASARSYAFKNPLTETSDVFDQFVGGKIKSKTGSVPINESAINDWVINNKAKQAGDQFSGEGTTIYQGIVVEDAVAYDYLTQVAEEAFDAVFIKPGQENLDALNELYDALDDPNRAGFWDKFASWGTYLGKVSSTSASAAITATGAPGLATLAAKSVWGENIDQWSTSLNMSQDEINNSKKIAGIVIDTAGFVKSIADIAKSSNDIVNKTNEFLKNKDLLTKSGKIKLSTREGKLLKSLIDNSKSDGTSLINDELALMFSIKDQISKYEFEQ